MQGFTVPVENIVFDGRTMYVNSDLGPFTVCGTMDIFHSDHKPVWGTFAGMLHWEWFHVPATVHFKDTFGVLCIDVPIFRIAFANAVYACGTLGAKQVVLTPLLGAPWCTQGRGLIVGLRSGEIVTALTE